MYYKPKFVWCYISQKKKARSQRVAWTWILLRLPVHPFSLFESNMFDFKSSYIPWLSFTVRGRGGGGGDNGCCWFFWDTPKTSNFIHALSLSPVTTTSGNKIRTRPVSFYRPPTESWHGCNSTLNPSFTITSPSYLCFPTPLTTPTISISRYYIL